MKGYRQSACNWSLQIRPETPAENEILERQLSGEVQFEKNLFFNEKGVLPGEIVRIRVELIPPNAV